MESIEIVKESKLSFFYTTFPSIFFIPSSTIFFIFPTSIFYLLLHNFNISPPPPHFFHFYSLLHNFIIFPPPPVYSIYIFSSTNTSTTYRPYIDPTSTPYRPYIDPRFNFFQHIFLNSETIYHYHHISIVFPPPPHFYCCPPPSHFYCFHSSYCFLTRHSKKAKLSPKRSNSNNLSSRKTKGGVKAIEMW